MFRALRSSPSSDNKRRSALAIVAYAGASNASPAANSLSRASHQIASVAARATKWRCASDKSPPKSLSTECTISLNRRAATLRPSTPTNKAEPVPLRVAKFGNGLPWVALFLGKTRSFVTLALPELTDVNSNGHFRLCFETF